ncbi:RNA polymerase sigma factor [Maricaulis maris]|uniref:RNA polymerase sigma-70 factor (ECF subfamily) n=1 Tax=Maricaulis maris TaxID=74318 RepID=A0A495DM24_9PROT|nr:sigma-70 family RNA polymerase sigma factor [Maricaulis maris]RKR03954.1 RNA polymerase sigma-70 factor (ECF subfamily) [Maricaulis maris]
MQRDRKRVLSEFLIVSAHAGDRRALDRLCQLWHGDLLRHAARLIGEAEAARDIMQEAWCDILRGLRRLREPAAFPAWAYRIVARKCAAEIRGRQTDRRTADGLRAELAGAAIDGIADAERQADQGAIRLAMADLPAEQHLALALYHQDGLSVAEIAVITDTAAGTVKTRLMHARRKLAAALNPEPTAS